MMDRDQRCGMRVLSLGKRLEEHTHLLSDRESLADLAIFPFVRQFANAEPSRF